MENTSISCDVLIGSSCRKKYTLPPHYGENLKNTRVLHVGMFAGRVLDLAGMSIPVVAGERA